MYNNKLFLFVFLFSSFIYSKFVPLSQAENSEQIQNFKEKVIKLTAADLKTFKQIQKGLKDLLNLIDELK